ncbi:MAG: hypothetical protein EBR87_10975, partial [Cytophagia bacterium]|nr:hypothetical protein [Cytophagia bacterium]
NENILTKIINEYTHEAGVRKLNEILYDIVRDINLKKIMGKLDYDEFPININIETMETTIMDILDNMNKTTIKKIHDIPRVGLVNGLYATSGSSLGGITIIQVMRIYSDKKFALEKITGSLGTVIGESMNCAMTLAWNILPDSIKKEIQESNDGYGLHIHCPEGSTPKDGPSAGLAITLGIISRLTEIPIKNDVAMTGEVDLIGNSLPIGGLHSKLMGALEAGIKTVLIPYENKNDLELILRKESSENQNQNEKIYFRETMEIILVKNIFVLLPMVFWLSSQGRNLPSDVVGQKWGALPLPWRALPGSTRTQPPCGPPVLQDCPARAGAKLKISREGDRRQSPQPGHSSAPGQRESPRYAWQSPRVAIGTVPCTGLRRTRFARSGFRMPSN